MIRHFNELRRRGRILHDLVCPDEILPPLPPDTTPIGTGTGGSSGGGRGGAGGSPPPRDGGVSGIGGAGGSSSGSDGGIMTGGGGAGGK